MKAIELTNLTDAQWISYLNLLKNIKKEYGNNSYIDDPEWKEFEEDFWIDDSEFNAFKDERLNKVQELKSYHFGEFVLFDNENAVAWLAYKIIYRKAEFIFDWIYDEVPREVLEKTFEVTSDFLNEHNKETAFTFSTDERKKKSLAKNGIKHYSELPLSKYERNENSVNYWNEIVNSNSFHKSYDLIFCNQIPEQLYDNYFTFINNYILDKNVFNPDKNSFSQIAKEQFIKSMTEDKEDDDPFYIYMLLDGKIIAAICSLYISKNRYGKVFLNHCGGATSVSRDYRGKGFARFLKAKMYLKCVKDFPDFEYIITNTYPWNKYMYRINKDMGFKDFAVEYKYKFTKGFLDEYSSK